MRSLLQRPVLLFPWLEGWLAFGVASMLPVWTIWRFDGFCGVGYPVSLWSLLAQLLQSRNDHVLVSGSWNDLYFGGQVFVAGAIAGGVAVAAKMAVRKIMTMPLH